MPAFFPELDVPQVGDSAQRLLAKLVNLGPLDSEPPEPEPPNVIGADWNIVFDGDSLTEGYYASVPELNYPAQLMAGEAADWSNVGVAGQRIDELAADAASRVDTLFDAEAGANVCVVFMGANDIIQGWEAQRNYNELAAYCRARRDAGWKVVVCTLPASDWTGAYLAQRGLLNQYIRTNQDLLCDAVADLEANENIGPDGAQDDTTYFNEDGLHFNDAGFAEIAAVVKPAVIDAVYDSVLVDWFNPRMYWEIYREPALENLTPCTYLADHAGMNAFVFHANPGNQPMVIDPAFSERKGIDFAGNQGLANTAGWTAGMSYTKVIVFRLESLNLNNLFSSTGNHALYFGNSPYTKLMLYHDGDANFLEGNTDLAVHTPYIVAVTYDADSNEANIYINSDTPDATGTADADATLNNSMALGTFGGSFGLNGQIAQAAAWDRVLNPSELATVLARLGSVYDIDVTVSESLGLSFSSPENSQYIPVV